jgi:hypothetical protein
LDFVLAIVLPPAPAGTGEEGEEEEEEPQIKKDLVG